MTGNTSSRVEDDKKYMHTNQRILQDALLYLLTRPASCSQTQLCDWIGESQSLKSPLTADFLLHEPYCPFKVCYIWSE